jgi:hypothetical protein
MSPSCYSNFVHLIILHGLSVEMNSSTDQNVATVQHIIIYASIALVTANWEAKIVLKYAVEMMIYN